MKILLKNQKRKISFIIILILLENIIGGYSYASIAFVTDNIIDNNIQNVLLFSLLGIGSFILASLISYIQEFQIKKFVQQKVYEIRGNLTQKLLNSDIRKFNSSKEKYFSTISNNLQIFEQDFLGEFFYLIKNLLSFLISMIWIFVFSWISGFLILTFVIIGSSLPFLLNKYYEKNYNNLFNNNDVYSQKINNILINFNNFYCFNRLKFFYNLLKGEHKKNMHHLTIFNRNNVVLNFITLFAFIILEIFGFVGNIGIYQHNFLTIGAIIAIIPLSEEALGSLSGLFDGILRMKSSKNLINNSALNYEYKTLIQNLDFKNKISFLNVNFKYGDNLNFLISNVNISFKKNKKYAILGPSGSGKSTLVKLLTKEINNFEGKIELDGKNCLFYNSSDLSKIINFIPNNPPLINGRLKDCITIFNSKIKIENEILEKYNLSNLNLNQKIIAEQSTLSQGEKQRIALIRSELYKKPILILDESLSNIDHALKNKIVANYLKDSSLTLIHVSHHFNEDELKKYDYLIKFDGQGNVYETKI